MDLSYLYLLYERTIQKVPSFTIYRSVQSAWPGVWGGRVGQLGRDRPRPVPGPEPTLRG